MRTWVHREGLTHRCRARRLVDGWTPTPGTACTNWSVSLRRVGIPRTTPRRGRGMPDPRPPGTGNPEPRPRGARRSRSWRNMPSRWRRSGAGWPSTESPGRPAEGVSPHAWHGPCGDRRLVSPPHPTVRASHPRRSRVVIGSGGCFGGSSAPFEVAHDPETELVDATRVAHGNLGGAAFFVVLEVERRCALFGQPRGTARRSAASSSLRLICRAVSAATSRSAASCTFG